ncbi:RasGEF domain-containing protein, partial [Reticulomyxa filosa]
LTNCAWQNSEHLDNSLLPDDFMTSPSRTTALPPFPKDGILLERGTNVSASLPNINAYPNGVSKFQKYRAIENAVHVRTKYTHTSDHATTTPTETAIATATATATPTAVASHQLYESPLHKLETSKIDAPNLLYMIDHVNRLSLWVATKILSEKTTLKQIEVCKYFYLVANRCFELNNIHGCTAIFGGICLEPVQRLKQMKKLLLADSVFKGYHEKFSLSNGLIVTSLTIHILYIYIYTYISLFYIHTSYISCVHVCNAFNRSSNYNSVQSCLPFVPVLVKDLFVVQTNLTPKNVQTNEREIDLKMLEKNCRLIRRFYETQQRSKLYANLLQTDVDTQTVIRMSVANHETLDTLKELSLKICPKMTKQQQENADAVAQLQDQCFSPFFFNHFLFFFLIIPMYVLCVFVIVFFWCFVLNGLKKTNACISICHTNDILKNIATSLAAFSTFTRFLVFTLFFIPFSYSIENFLKTHNKVTEIAGENLFICSTILLPNRQKKVQDEKKFKKTITFAMIILCPFFGGRKSSGLENADAVTTKEWDENEKPSEEKAAQSSQIDENKTETKEEESPAKQKPEEKANEQETKEKEEEEWGVWEWGCCQDDFMPGGSVKCSTDSCIKFWHFKCLQICYKYPKKELARIKKPEEIFTCPSCQRHTLHLILYDHSSSTHTQQAESSDRTQSQSSHANVGNSTTQK